MNKKIELLDCTLRDGGYVIDWDFGHSVITGTYKRLDAAGAEYIEVGFLDDRRPFDINRSIMPSTDALNDIFKNVTKRNAVPVAMIDFGTCALKNISDCDSTFIDGIRIIFKKEKIDEALPYCQAIKNKGYKLFIQAVSITSYSDKEMLEYVERINQIKPHAFSIVDTYGLLDKVKLTKYFYLIDNNLHPEIVMGYHAHNNFQLGFSNAINLLSLETQRNIVVDSSVYGMGKSAGNCPTELLAMHLNNHNSKNYDISQILEIVDTDLMAIHKKTYWGYKYNFFISALNDCHPEYVHHLLSKKTLSVSAVNTILESIPPEKKLNFSEQLIERLYFDYQEHAIDDTTVFEQFRQQFSNKTILVLGPGRSIIDEKSSIDEYITENAPITISVNFVPEQFRVSYAFFSNAKRYAKLADVLSGEKISSKIITTSNIVELDYPIDYVFNYHSLLSEKTSNSDNALILLLNAMIKLELPHVVLAGFDGFSSKNNYGLRDYSFGTIESGNFDINKQLSDALTEINKDIEIEFLTPTLYQISDTTD